MRREASRVSFLMCPFCVRVMLPDRTTSEADASRGLEVTRMTRLRRHRTGLNPLSVDWAQGCLRKTLGLHGRLSHVMSKDPG
jgi:hypothetical protein